MYNGRAFGGMSGGVLAVTGVVAPSATLMVIGALAIVVGALLVWRSHRLRAVPHPRPSSTEGRSRT